MLSSASTFFLELSVRQEVQMNLAMNSSVVFRTMGVPKTLSVQQGQKYVHNNAKMLYAFSTVLIFALMAEITCVLA